MELFPVSLIYQNPIIQFKIAVCINAILNSLWEHMRFTAEETQQESKLTFPWVLLREKFECF